MNKTNKKSLISVLEMILGFLGMILGLSLGYILSYIFNITLLPLCVCIGLGLVMLCVSILYPKNQDETE